MGAKSSKKAITDRSSRASSAPAKKKASRRASGSKAAKYSDTGAPWWKRFLPE